MLANFNILAISSFINILNVLVYSTVPPVLIQKRFKAARSTLCAFWQHNLYHGDQIMETRPTTAYPQRRITTYNTQNETATSYHLHPYQVHILLEKRRNNYSINTLPTHLFIQCVRKH